MGFVLGENLSEVFIIFGNRRRIGLSLFVDTRQVFGETEDSIEVQDVDFIVGVDFGSKAYFRRQTYRFFFQNTERILGFSLSDPPGSGNFRLCGKNFRGFWLFGVGRFFRI